MRKSGDEGMIGERSSSSGDANEGIDDGEEKTRMGATSQKW